MKYLRTYPWGLQVLLFLSMILTFMGFGSFLVYIFLPKLTPYTPELLEHVSQTSPASMINAALMVQGILSVFIFMIPAWLFAYLAHPEPSSYIGLRAPGKKIQWMLVLLLMLGAMPVLQGLEGLISLIDFGPKIKASQEANEHLTMAFMQMTDFASFVRTFFVMAIIPAVGEEMFFRGIAMRFNRKRTKNMVFPIFFTSVIFAYAHSNIYGFLSIFLAGVLLAVIYNLTGSLWCSILAHLFFNGSQVTLSYLSKTNAGVKAFMESSSVPVYLIVGGAVLFSGALFMLMKNKTPLPENWTEDFPKPDPEKQDWDFMNKD